DLMSLSTLDDIKNRLRRSDENQRIKTAIDANTSWNDEEKMKAIIASRYLNSVSKGGNALTLSLVLEENRKRKEDDEEKFTFVVPQYIEEALRWLLS
ncbi:MAG: ATP-dependent endonuclease, partial [Paludibacteraceae bacterium]|nr:ATP-dependent endonuclease [Paludibacteraceae bacterium]